MHPNNVSGTSDSVDSDLTVHLEQSDMGLHYLLRPIHPNTYNSYSNSSEWVKGWPTDLAVWVPAPTKTEIFSIVN